MPLACFPAFEHIERRDIRANRVICGAGGKSVTIERTEDIGQRSRKRVIDKSGHRIELLDATARVIAAHGIAGTTIDRIQQESRLSRGMINLHFVSKENLFLELLRHLGEKYVANWRKAIAGEGLSPIDRLRSLIRSDFSQGSLNEIDSAVWICFRAEAPHHEDIRRLVGTRDTMFGRELVSCFNELQAQGRLRVRPEIASEALLNLLEGYQLDFHVNQTSFDRERAATVCLEVVRCFLRE